MTNREIAEAVVAKIKSDSKHAPVSDDAIIERIAAALTQREREVRAEERQNCIEQIQAVDRRDGPKRTDWIREGEDAAYREGLDDAIEAIRHSDTKEGS